MFTAIDYVNQRDQEEISRLRELEDYRKHVVTEKEAQFRKFWEIYDEACKCLNGDVTTTLFDGKIKSNTVKCFVKIIKNSILDMWAFWLDQYSTLLANSREFAMCPERLAFIENQRDEIMLDFRDLEKFHGQVPSWLREMMLQEDVSNIQYNNRILLNAPHVFNQLSRKQ